MKSESIALLIQAQDRTGVLFQLTRTIAAHGANIGSVDIVKAGNPCGQPLPGAARRQGGGSAPHRPERVWRWSRR